MATDWYTILLSSLIGLRAWDATQNEHKITLYHFLGRIAPSVNVPSSFGNRSEYMGRKTSLATKEHYKWRLIFPKRFLYLNDGAYLSVPPKVLHSLLTHTSAKIYWCNVFVDSYERLTDYIICNNDYFLLCRILIVENYIVSKLLTTYTNLYYVWFSADRILSHWNTIIQ